jgi:RNA polymerase sigma factor (sigma-70 family)
MDEALRIDRMAAEQDSRIANAVERERGRLRNFIRRRVTNDEDAEDILQEAFYELVAATRLTEPIEQIGAWLFRVARNRIIDRFRKRRPEVSSNAATESGEEGERRSIEDLFPSPDAGPEATFARGLMIEALDEALDELPDDQRDVFLAHEMEGRSFKEISAETGVSVNTLLSRKHYAVLFLRERLYEFYKETGKGW